MSVTRPASSTARARTPVVPASMATTVPTGPTIGERGLGAPVSDSPMRPLNREDLAHFGRADNFPGRRCVFDGVVEVRVRHAPMRRTALVAVLAASASLVASPALAATEHHESRTSASPRPVLVKSGPVAVLNGNCSAGSMEARVTISRLVFRANQPVSVRAVVRNVGTVPCDYAGYAVGPQTIGPCGMISMEIENRAGVNVWPGNAAYFCPM